MKSFSKGSLAGHLVLLDASSAGRLAPKNLKSPNMPMIVHYPTQLASDARLYVRGGLTSSCPDAILVAPLKSKSPYTLQLQQVQHARSHRKLCRAHELKAYMREVHLIKVKHCEDTRPGHQLEAPSKQHDHES